MRLPVRPRPTACVAVALIAVLFTAPRGLPAQSTANPRFDALVVAGRSEDERARRAGRRPRDRGRRRGHYPRARRHQRRGPAARRRAHRLPDRVDLQDVCGDGDDAAGRAGQGRSARAGADLPARVPRPRRSREPRRDGLASPDAPRRLGRAGVGRGAWHRDAEDLRRVDRRPDADRAAGQGVELQQRGLQRRRARHRGCRRARPSIAPCATSSSSRWASSTRERPPAISSSSALRPATRCATARPRCSVRSADRRASRLAASACA